MQAAHKAVTVVVVEDDWLIREDMVTDLRQEGWAVLEAATGAGALQTLREAEKVDLLITDIKLADALTGWDVAEAFRTSHPEVPVIYASGNPANNHRRVRGERLPLQAGSRFGAYRDLPQASDPAEPSVNPWRPRDYFWQCTAFTNWAQEVWAQEVRGERLWRLGREHYKSGFVRIRTDLRLDSKAKRRKHRRQLQALCFRKRW